MSKFANTIRIVGSKSELDEAVSFLERLGYAKCHYSDYETYDKCIVTNIPNFRDSGLADGTITDYRTEVAMDHEIIVKAPVVKSTDLRLIKALASTRVDGEYQAGEILYFNHDAGCYAKTGSMIVVETCPSERTLGEDYVYVRWLKEVDVNGNVAYKGTSSILQKNGTYSKGAFRRATIGEITELFNNLKPGEMEQRVIYRFKKAVEFQQEYGEDWRRKVPASFTKHMDYMLGTEVTAEDYERVMKTKEGGWDNVSTCGFSVSKEMLKKEGAGIVTSFEVIKAFPGSGAVGTILFVNGSDFTLEQGTAYPEFYKPIYEKVIKWETVTIGSPEREIRISSEGNVTMERHGISSTIAELQDTADRTFGYNLDHAGIPTLSPGYYTYVKSVWLGCEESGTELRREDIRKIMVAYNKIIQ